MYKDAAASEVDYLAFPQEGWKRVLFLAGLPVERKSGGLQRFPWATWGLAAVVTLVSLSAFANLERVVQQYGMIPAQFWRYGGLTVLTSFFLHGNWFHLLGNMYFLLVFGDNVEEYLGRARYAWLLFFATLTGDVCHAVFQPYSSIPAIGASGGISGLVAFYALQFPRSEIYLWVFFWPVRVTAKVMLAFWITLQIVGAVEQLSGTSAVASLAHLGGAAAGYLSWRQWGKN